jgi:hypothetical protein
MEKNNKKTLRNSEVKNIVNPSVKGYELGMEEVTKKNR